MIVLFMMWSILAVEAIGPINQTINHSHDYCEVAFESVWKENLWFFQTIMAGYSWSQCARPIIRKEPWTFLIFFGAFATVLMGFGNLILAVIVARAEEARHDDVKRRMKDKAIYEQKELASLLSMCQEIDIDSSGGVTSFELLNAYDNHEELSTMLRLMDIGREDLECIYRLIDEDGTDHVHLVDFVSKLHKIKENNVHTTTMFIKSQLHQMFQIIQESTATIMAKISEAALPECENVLLASAQPSFTSNPSLKAPTMPDPNACRERLIHRVHDLEATLQSLKAECKSTLLLQGSPSTAASAVYGPNASVSSSLETDIPFDLPLMSVPALVFDTKFMPSGPIMQSVHDEIQQVQRSITEVICMASQSMCLKIEHQLGAFLGDTYRRGVSYPVAVPTTPCGYLKTP